MSIKNFICTLASVIILCSTLPVYSADLSDGYEWKQLKLGGGGYVTGAIFHPKAEGLAYIKTDVGGMYRRDSANEEWKQLFDFPSEENNLYGVDGFAIDPNNADVVYAALGMYYWLDGGLYKSTDRGETWTKLMTIRCNGNKGRRNYGECIAVDPLNSKVVYFGTRTQGLYRSDDGGETWENVTGIDFEVDSEKGHGIRNIVVDTSNGTVADGSSAVVYIGSAGVGVYRSTDGGKTFTLLDGSPADPFRMDVSSTGKLYVSASDGLFKLDGEEWTDISPVAGKIYQALAVSPTNPEFIIACVNSGNKMKMPVYLSKDGGKTWSNTFENVQFTEQVGWLESDNFSSNTASIAIDPFNTKHVMLTDWFGVWETDDITHRKLTLYPFSYSPSVKWYQRVYGLEEMCCYKAVCPPEGDVRLHLGVMDNDGFSIKNLDEYPERKFTDRFLTYGGPRIQATTDIAFCESDPDIVVRAGIGYPAEVASYSLDGGETWNEFEVSPIEDATGAGCNVALSCKKNEDTGYPTIIFNQSGCAVKMSRDMGKTWTVLPFENIQTPNGSRDYNRIETDKVNPDKFYIRNSENVLCISDDGGNSWYEGATIPQSTGYLHIRSAPGMENEIWVGVGGEKLYRSSDGGKTLSPVYGISDVQAFCFGMPMKGCLYPAAYVYATVYGTKGIYRSINMGKSWIKINPDDFVLKSATFMEGDRQQEGVIYFAHSGTGVYYLQPKNNESKVKGTEYCSDFKNNSDNWTFSGNMSKQASSLGCGAWGTKGEAVLEDYVFSGSYEIYAEATCKGAGNANHIEIRFNYQDQNNYLALDILGGNNSELTGGARLYKKQNGKVYVFSGGQWYENISANSEKISEGLVHYKTDSYTYSYRIVCDSDGYITVYRNDKYGNKSLMFDNCMEPDIRHGKLSFYAGATTGELASVFVKTNPVIVRKLSADSDKTAVSILDNGFLPGYSVIWCEKDSRGILKRCSVEKQLFGKQELNFPAVDEGNTTEIFVFDSMNKMYPAAYKMSAIRR